MLQNHKDLEVWQFSVDLAAYVYRFTSFLPREEKYGMAGQMRSAAVSIASNIAEGAARGSRKDFIRFLNMAAGSASELDTHLEILLWIGATDLQELGTVRERLETISRMIQGLIRSLR